MGDVVFQSTKKKIKFFEEKCIWTADYLILLFKIFAIIVIYKMGLVEC